MYLPSYENRTSEMDEMISEKKDLDEGSSSCSKTVAFVYMSVLPVCICYVQI
jgi:hypothetical protein